MYILVARFAYNLRAIDVENLTRGIEKSVHTYKHHQSLNTDMYINLYLTRSGLLFNLNCSLAPLSR